MIGGRMAMGTALLDLTRLAQRHHTPVPSSMTLLGKAMLNLDGTIRVLSPELDPVQLIRDYMLQVMEKRVRSQLSAGRVFAWILDMKHLFENAPRRTDMVLDKLANDQITLRLEIDQLDDAVKIVNKAARRLSLSVLIGALIIGGGFAWEALRKADRLKGGRR
jgi:predicted unusual protein kinase regulating ubiquinone biosynthesis (AarF/ABC1/UbiB family)